MKRAGYTDDMRAAIRIGSYAVGAGLVLGGCIFAFGAILLAVSK